ncbi:hypothetical protein O1Q96_39785 [Streptomyces sp. Qhu-G9]|uniref:hypothetical protein n=1 Tax=Streptomyces sp. Qhu-G9 TaxID=3452799 RepID=UPI0022ABEFDE|nr:hypothetical protein [Streptomyces aurantiacus]WAU85310.1 hypothetical protein O1Q96_39785 [Streptomyces aurantiacus]
MESPETRPPAAGEPTGREPSAEAPAGRTEPLADFVPDPAARAELARRMSELADLIDEAGDALGEILEDVQRGFDSAERSRGVKRSST